MKLPSLPELSIRRPVTVIMLAISALCIGVIAFVRIPVEFMPKMELPFIGCFIPYPGATPEQVEAEVAIPAEGQFRTISHVRRITTTSNTNGCMVRILFDWDADMTVATADIRDRMERLKLELPDEIDRLMLRKFSSDSMPVMVFSLYGQKDIEELAHDARTRIQQRLARVEGVADVEVFSRPPKEVLIEFDQNRLRSSNMSMYTVVDLLRRSNFTMSLGEITEGDQKYFVRALAEFDHPDELAALTVGDNGMTLSDLADVGYKGREIQEAYTIDGKQGAFVLVRKESEANAIDTCQRVLEELSTIKVDPQFGGLETLMFFDQSEMILAAVGSLLDAGKFGALLSLIVLLLFLQRIRPTVIVAFSIPTSLVIALVYMYFSGMTLNLVTLISMIIGVGMLVDNSIVVIENIYRHQQLGFSPRDAAIKGASEVGLAVTAATITTIVVFIPTFYLEQGEMAVYMLQFAAPVSVALLGSLLVSLTLIPLAASRMKAREHLKIYKYWLFFTRRFTHRFDRATGTHLARTLHFHPFRWLVTAYLNLLALSLRWRVATIAMIGVVFAVTAAVPGRGIGFQQMPTVDTRQVDISFEFEPNVDFPGVQATLDLVENVLEKRREDLDIKNIWRRAGVGRSEMTVYLKAPEDYTDGQVPKYSTEDTLSIMSALLPAQVPEGTLSFFIPDAGEGQSRSFQLWMQGDEIAKLRGHADSLRQLLSNVEGVTDITVGDEDESEEMQIHIDEDLSNQAGVSPMVIAQTIDFALRGIRLTPLKQEDREVDVWAQFQEQDRRSRENLENIAIPTVSGELAPVIQFVDLVRARSPEAITRIDGKNVVSLTIQTNTKDMGQLNKDIREIIRGFTLPLGYSVGLGDEFTEMDGNISNFVTSSILSTVLIFIVMGALFESYLLPLSILMSIPVSFVGSLWVMYLTGTSFDTVSMIGLILMLGIVVNNGIVIVDYINQLRQGGMDRTEAILQAGRDRIRPVLMTALTTILGCVPLAMEGSVGTEVSFASLGRALIGGLTTGTFLTLYVVPVVYTLIDDLRLWFMEFFADFASMMGRPAPDEDGDAFVK